MNKDKYVKVAYERLAKNGSCLGYCNLHNCHLTLKDLNKKNCVDKQCNHLIKKEHMYWTNKLLTKENRLLGKSLNFSNTDINTYRNVWKSLVNFSNCKIINNTFFFKSKDNNDVLISTLKKDKDTEFYYILVKNNKGTFKQSWQKDKDFNSVENLLKLQKSFIENCGKK